MNILMIGNKESGKTTYMASAFGLLEGGISGFYIRTDASSQSWFHKLFSEIKMGNYPSATDKRGSYEFALYYNQNKILDFNWIDYNGGVITEQSIDNLEIDIDKSEGMMIFLEAEALWRNITSVHKFRRILALISSHLENSENPLFSVVIVLTKYDRIPLNVSIKEVTEYINMFLEEAKQNDKLYVRVVPVSCTSKGFYNVELPLLDILDSGMKIDYLTKILEVNSYAEEYKKYDEQRGIIDWGISRLLGVKTNGEIADEYLQMALQKIELFEKIEKPTEYLSSYVENYTIRYPNVGSIDVAPNKLEQKNSHRFIEL